MLKLEQILMSLLAREVLGKSVNDKEICGILSVDLKKVEALYELSNLHDMSHIVCLALKNIGVWGKEDVYRKFQRQQTMAVYRCEKQLYELEKVASALEKAEIPFIPLKGACIRPFYPQSWMRTSSDIDILVQKKDKKRAEEAVVNDCGYSVISSANGETTLHNENGFCVELHHRNEKQRVEEIPQDVWEKAACRDGSSKYLMSNEMLYYHTVSHMIKHVAWSGCGIKPFLDMYLLEKSLSLDFEAITQMFRKAKLLKAYNALHKTAEYWFDGKEGDKLTSIIRKHVIMGGAYGNQITGTNMLHRNKGGKIRYIFSLFLPDRQEMERRYPILKEHPSRLPLYHIKRWGHLIFKGRIKSSAEIVGKQMAVPKENVKELDYMIKEMGLG